LLEETQGSLNEEEPASQADGLQEHGLPLEMSSDWRDARTAALKKLDPANSPKKSDDMRELRHFLLAALTFVSIGVALAAIDEKWPTAHLTAVVALLMLAVVATSVIAMYRMKRAIDLTRTAGPSLRDAVTELPDEEYFRLRLREEFKRIQRYQEPMSLAIFDVNNLTSVNEAYGESTGDAVLKHIADLLQSTKRASDIIARLSDDEFALILLECNQDDAVNFLRRFEQYVTRHPATVNVEGQAITLWIGICSGLASAQPGDSNPAELVAQARRNLEAAKGERDHRRERWTRVS